MFFAGLMVGLAIGVSGTTMIALLFWDTLGLRGSGGDSGE